MVRNTNIYLTGFSGSGKSTLGKLLAERLGMQFYDTDEMIASKESKAVGDIFNNEGEKFFRKREHEIISELSVKQDRKVIALGGGALLSKKNRDLILSNGLLIYLSCSLVELYRRLKDLHNRPLLNIKGNNLFSRKDQMNQIKVLLEKRKIHYRMAPKRVSTTGKTVSESLKELLKIIQDAGY